MNEIEKHIFEFYRFHSKEFVKDLQHKMEEELKGKELTKENMDEAMLKVLWGPQSPHFFFNN